MIFPADWCTLIDERDSLRPLVFARTVWPLLIVSCLWRKLKESAVSINSSYTWQLSRLSFASPRICSWIYWGLVKVKVQVKRWNHLDLEENSLKEPTQPDIEGESDQMFPLGFLATSQEWGSFLPPEQLCSRSRAGFSAEEQKKETCFILQVVSS